MTVIIRTSDYRGDHAADVELTLDVCESDTVSEVMERVEHMEWDEIVFLPKVKEAGE